LDWRLYPGPDPFGRLPGRSPIDVFLEGITLTLAALLPITNPFSTAPLFASLTTNFDARRQRQQAFLACVYALAILVTFLVLGRVIIEFFGISIPGIRVAGGLIIATVGFRMLFPGPPRTGEAVAAQEDIAFTPIAMPSLAGPGSIAVVLGAAAQIQRNRPDDWLLVYFAVIAGMVVTLTIAYAVLHASAKMVRVLGPGGIDAMTRIFGFLLICIAMQFLLTGISDFFGLERG